jgi:excisionase family DNA binding protein
MTAPPTALLSVDETARRLGVSVSTVWRLLRRGALPSVRQGGRRLVPDGAVRKRASDASPTPEFDDEHPIFRLVGAGRSGGVKPGARDKHAILDR